MGARAGVILFCLLISMPTCIGEDRTERINGAAGWKELLYRDDALVEERSFDADGGLLMERSFSPEAIPVVTKRFVREFGHIAKIEATDASGNPIGGMSYHYDRDGRLILVSSEGVLGGDAVGMMTSSGTPQGSWISSESKTTIIAYDEAGRANLLQYMKDGKVTSIEKRNYGTGGALASVAVDDKSSGTSTTISYDEKGRQSQRKEVAAKGEEALTQYDYDDSGRLVEEEKRSGGHVLSTRRSYATDGTQSRVETRRDGSLILAVDYAGATRVEELYEDGTLFVKATYIGGRKVKDEFYADGVLQRSREYQ
jgi:YD repeat-containing protein